MDKQEYFNLFNRFEELDETNEKALLKRIKNLLREGKCFQVTTHGRKRKIDTFKVVDLDCATYRNKPRPRRQKSA